MSPEVDGLESLAIRFGAQLRRRELPPRELIGEMTQPRIGHAVAALGQDVLIAGGQSGLTLPRDVREDPCCSFILTFCRRCC